MALIICPECNHEVSDQAKKCPNCGYPLTKNKQKRESTESSRHHANKIVLMSVIIALVIVTLGIVGYWGINKYVLVPNRIYQEADLLATSGQYISAIESFAELGNYKDSLERINECKYAEATRQLSEKQYDTAKNIFIELGNYKDSADKSKECDYAYACEVYESGEIKDALVLFESIVDYQPAMEMVKECRYQKATKIMNDNNFILLNRATTDEALETLASILDYKDSERLYYSKKYELAKGRLKLKRYQEAREYFASMPDYEDSLELYLQCYWDEVQDLVESDNTEDAIKLCLKMSNEQIENAKAYAHDLYLSLISKCVESKRYTKAFEVYNDMYEDGFDDVPNLLRATCMDWAQTAIKENGFQFTMMYLGNLSKYDFKDDRKIEHDTYIEIAKAAYKSGDDADAIETYKTMATVGFEDAESLLADMYATMYADAEKAMKNGKYATAQNTFSVLSENGYLDSAKKYETANKKYKEAKKAASDKAAAEKAAAKAAQEEAERIRMKAYYDLQGIWELDTYTCLVFSTSAWTRTSVHDWDMGKFHSLDYSYTYVESENMYLLEDPFWGKTYKATIDGNRMTITLYKDYDPYYTVLFPFSNQYIKIRDSIE